LISLIPPPYQDCHPEPVEGEGLGEVEKLKYIEVLIQKSPVTLELKGGRVFFMTKKTVLYLMTLYP
jgi:hypothetical protein